MKTLPKLAPALALCLLALLAACGESKAGEMEIPTVEEARTEATQADRAQLEERIAELEAALRERSEDLQDELAKLKDLDPKEMLEEGAAELKEASARLQDEVSRLTDAIQVYRAELQRKLE